jgi:decaprenylphospho-beta-D-ribofuranose 2-oxidase
MPVTRRELGLLAAAGALDAACGAAPKIVGPVDPRPESRGLPADCPAVTHKVEALSSFDGMHEQWADVYHPASEEQLCALLACIPKGRSVTLRGGGQSLDCQALNDDIVIRLDSEPFTFIGDPPLVPDDDGYSITTGAGATWWDVLRKISPLGFVPPSLATAGAATVGGTMSADCVSRMSGVHGKEGNQIRSFKLVRSSGETLVCSRSDTDPYKKELFHAVIGGFGYLGAVTEVTFDLVPARSEPGVCKAPPAVFTRSTRHGANVDWDSILLSLRTKALITRQRFEEARSLNRGRADGNRLAAAPEWSGLSIASFLCASGMSANLLEQRFVEPQVLKPMPGGVYDKDSTFPGNAALLQSDIPTWVELAVRTGFPAGEFVDELFGWAFFLGNYTRQSQRKAAGSGDRANFYQQSFALPAGCEDGKADTRYMRRFVEILESRLHAIDKRPATIDFLYVPGDEFLMSASRDFPSFVVTVSFGDKNLTSFPPQMDEFFRRLSHDCLTLGGRVHLVKNVIADPADLRAMHGAAAQRFTALKKLHDPKHLFKNAFFHSVFEA